MDQGILIAIIVGAGMLGLVKLASALNPKPSQPGGTVIFVPGRPRGGLSAAQLFLPHVVSFLSINALGFVSTVLSGFAVDQAWPWWSALPLILGWLIVWGFVVNPIVYPAAYRKWLESQKRITEPAYVLYGIAALVWLIANLVAVAPLLSVG